MKTKTYSNSRIWWKAAYRLLRISRREMEKAANDVMIFGTGVVLVPKDGSDPRHIPFNDLSWYSKATLNENYD